MEKYLLLAEGCDRISIAYLADAVGVSKATAVGDLGQMVADNRFGVSAYIDYTALELILNPGASRTCGTQRAQSGGAASPADDVWAAAWQQAKSSAGRQARSWAQRAAQKAEQMARQAAQSVHETARTSAASPPSGRAKPAGGAQRPAERAARPAKGADAAGPASGKTATPRVKRKIYLALLLPGLVLAAAGIASLAVSLDFLVTGGFLPWLITGGCLSAAGGSLLAIRGSFSGTINSFGVKGLDVERFLKLFPPVSARLKDVPLENKNALQLIRERDRPDGLVYADPPYVKTERLYRIAGKLGRFRKFHVRLWQVLTGCDGYVVLSYNDCPFIRKLYQDWYILSFQRSNPLSQKKGSSFGELIITNYDPRPYMTSQMNLFDEPLGEWELKLVHIPKYPPRRKTA